MGLKRLPAFTLIILLTLLFLPLSTFADGGLLSIKIEQTDVKMPQLKVYLNLAGQDDERAAKAGTDKQYSAMLDGEKIDVVSAESFAQSGEGFVAIYLMDISKSLAALDFEDIKQQMLKSIQGMSGSDKAAIITFGEDVDVICDYTSSKQELSEKIEELELTDMHTRFYDGVKKALDLARIQDESLPDRRVIVTITDGSDAFAGGSTRQEVIDDVKADPVPMYALGIYKGSLNSEKQQALDALGEFARTSGGLYYQMGKMTFEEVFEGIRAGINSTQVITLDCGFERADGKVHELYIALEADGKKFEDISEILLGTNMRDTTPPVITGVDSRDEYSVTLAFSEDVTGADYKSNYEVFDSDGEKIIPSEAVYTGAGVFEATITFDRELSGEYKIEVSGIYDISDTPNEIVPAEKSFLVDNVDAYDMQASQNYDKDKNDFTIYYIIGGGALALTAIFFVIVLIKREKKKAIKTSSPAITGEIPKTRPLYSAPKNTQVSAGKAIHFAVTDKDEKTSSIDLKIARSLTIGRSKDSELSFNDDEMSRKHCEITFENGKLYANDLNATNTTIVNGVPINQRIRLNSGDVLLVGQTEIKITWKEEDSR